MAYKRLQCLASDAVKGKGSIRVLVAAADYRTGCGARGGIIRHKTLAVGCLQSIIVSDMIAAGLDVVGVARPAEDDVATAGIDTVHSCAASDIYLSASDGHVAAGRDAMTAPADDIRITMTDGDTATAAIDAKTATVSIAATAHLHRVAAVGTAGDGHSATTADSGTGTEVIYVVRFRSASHFHIAVANGDTATLDATTITTHDDRVDLIARCNALNSHAIRTSDSGIAFVNDIHITILDGDIVSATDGTTVAAQLQRVAAVGKAGDGQARRARSDSVPTLADDIHITILDGDIVSAATDGTTIAAHGHCVSFGLVAGKDAAVSSTKVTTIAGDIHMGHS